jgi:hypothetical protein
VSSRFALFEKTRIKCSLSSHFLSDEHRDLHPSEFKKTLKNQQLAKTMYQFLTFRYHQAMHQMVPEMKFPFPWTPDKPAHTARHGGAGVCGRGGAGGWSGQRGA